MDIQLTRSFNIKEFLYSDTINSIKDDFERKMFLKFQNKLTIYEVLNLYTLCDKVLQPVRDKLGMIITVNSGYRCPILNNKINGSKTSQHISGHAADVTCMDNYHLLELLKQQDYDQLICYGSPKSPRFIHVSYVTPYSNRKMFFTKP